MSRTVPTLEGVRIKLNRAEQHLSQLYSAINAWSASEREDDSLIFYPDYERKLIDIEVGKIQQGDPTWPAIIGDAVHNLRSALDHLVCQLALLNGNPLSCCENTFFPICIHETSFQNAKRKIEEFIHPDALALIERLQPYKAAQSTASNPSSLSPVFSNLWIVSQLDIIDKHRMLVVVGQYLGSVKLSYTVNNGGATTVPAEASWRPLENGAQIARDLSAVLLNREDKVRVQMESEAKIFFNNTGCCDGLQVDNALSPCLRHVTAIIDEFESRFFSK